MDLYVEVVGLQTNAEPPGLCRVCLQSSEHAKLSHRNMSAFYSICDPGSWLRLSEKYAWICPYCWARALQCIKFVQCARRSFNTLRHISSLTDVKSIDLLTYSIVNLEDTIICDSEDCRETIQPAAESLYDESQNDISFPFKSENSIDEIKEEPLSSDSDRRSDGETSGACRSKKNKRSSLRISFPKCKKTTETPSKSELRGDDNEKLKQLCAELISYSKGDQMEEVRMKKSSQKYQQSKHKCEKCGAAYNEEETYEGHVKKWHSESAGRYECTVCHYRFATAALLNKHTAEHGRRWRCLRCGRVLSLRQQLASHNVRCSRTQLDETAETLRCHLCGGSYPTSLRLKVHIRRAHRQASKRFTCDTCSKSFLYKSQIRDHIRSHTGVKPFECETCGKKSKTMTLHKVHLTVHAPRERREDSYCVECDRFFKSPFFLEKHLTGSLFHVTKDVYRHACTECPDRFPVASQLLLHVNTVHLKNRSHPCTMCNKAYFTKGGLRIHVMNKHTERERARDHVCGVCGRAFLAKTSLNHHIVAIHNKERPYECGDCRATFGYKAALFTHKRLKHKDKP